MRREQKRLGDMKCGIELNNTSRHELQGEPKFVNLRSAAPRNADNSSWNILARALARERASKLKDDISKAQAADPSCDTLQDDPEATNASSTQALPPRNEDQSWAILARALEEERETQFHKNLLRKCCDVIRTECSPGTSIEDAIRSGEPSREIDRCARKDPVASTKGKEIYKAREFKSLVARDKDRKWQRKNIRGHAVANPFPANLKVETESISPRVSTFVSSVLDSFLRGEEHALRKSPIAAVSTTDAKSRFLNRWKNEASVSGGPCHCQRSHDSGPECFFSPARPNSPRSYGKVETDSSNPRMSPFVSSIFDSFIRGEEYALKRSPIAAGLLVGHAKSRLRSKWKNEVSVRGVPCHFQHARDSGPELFLCSAFPSPRRAEPQAYPTAKTLKERDFEWSKS